MKNWPASVRYSFFILSIILTLYALVEARIFLYPIALGILFAYLLYPIANFLEQNNFPRIVANLISIILGLALVTGAFFFIYKQISGFLEEFPVFKAKALENIDVLETQLGKLFGVEDFRLLDFLRQRVVGLFEAGSTFLNKAFQTTAGTLFRILMLPVFIFLFLYYRTKFAYFILKLVPHEKRFLTITVLREVSRVTSRYMGGMTTVVIILCIVNSLGFLLIGLDFAIVLGVIAALFNFIPYFGTVIGYSVPFGFALLTGDNLYLALQVVIQFVLVQFSENNILTPNIVGGSVKLNPFIIILGLIASALIWGIPGMFIVVPFLAVMRIIASHVDHLHPIAFLLGTGGTRRHAITGENIKRFIKTLKNKMKNKRN